MVRCVQLRSPVNIVTVRIIRPDSVVQIMDHLDEITVEELHDTLDKVEGTKPTQRLLAAIVYKNGIS